MRATELSPLLAARAEDVCRHLLPAGTVSHGNWVIGSVNNDAGKSLHVALTGNDAGVWLDFATGEKGNLLTLWQAATGCSLKDACTQAMDFLGLEPEPEDRPEPTKAWTQLQREMGTGTEDDIETLLRLRRLPSANGLYLAREREHLFFGPVFDKPANAPGVYHHSWIVTDGARLGAQARRMDGKPYGDGQKSKTIHGTTGKWPVGIHGHSATELALVEGGPDFLAAYTAIAALGAHHIQPVAMLGSSQQIHPEALPLFRDRTVWMFPHNDTNLAGLQGAIRWEAQLRRFNATVIPFDFSAYPGVKDLNDFVSAMPSAASAAQPTAAIEEEIW